MIVDPHGGLISAKAFLFGSACGVFLLAGGAQAAGPTQAELDDAANDGANWLYVDHDYRGHRYTPLDQINAKNVADLVQVCSYSFPEKMPSQTARIVYDGVIFATTAHYTVALDGASCKPIWQYQTTRRTLHIAARLSKTAK
jgi:glucose dehydrogenase